MSVLNQVVYVSVLVVLVVTVAIGPLVAVPGGHHRTDTRNHTRGEAIVSDNSGYHIAVICVVISVAICVVIAGVHTMVDTLDDGVWKRVVVATKILTWIIAFAAGWAFIELVKISLGPHQPGMKAAVDIIFFVILIIGYTGIVTLWFKYSKKKEREERE